jgi:hypothetical protein
MARRTGRMTLTRRAVSLILGTGIIATLTITFMTWIVSPTRIAPGVRALCVACVCVWRIIEGF